MYTDDSLIVNAVLNGDRDGYRKLVDKYKKMVYGIAWSHLGDPDLSEDAAQETFLKAYTYLGTLREPDKFAGWLARIARNVCNTFGRGMKRERAFRNRWAVLESAEAGQQEEGRESSSKELWDAFARLPAIHREALTLFYVEGKSMAEASAALGITEQAMRTRLHRARRVMRVQLERMLGESLSGLQPGSGFTRSVIILLPLAPKGAAGVGLLAGLGKLSASVSFLLWGLAASALSGWAYSSLIGRVEESSLPDVPQNRRARAMIRGAYRNMAYLVFVTVAAFFVLERFVGFKTAFQIMAAVDSCILLFIIIWDGPRLLGRLRAADILSSGILFLVLMLAPVAAVAFFNAPMVTLNITMIAVFVIAFFAAPKMPIGPEKIGFNLFLRQARGLPELPEIDLSLSRELSRLELRSYARMLAELRLVREYKPEGDGVRIFLYDMGFGLVPNGSEMTIGANRECSAVVSDADLGVIRKIVDPSISENDLKESACRTIRYAMSLFAEGRIQEVRDILSFKPDRSSLMRVRNLRIMSLINIWLFGTFALAPFLTSKVHGLIGAIVFFVIIIVAPLIALAITLSVNKRLMSSIQQAPNNSPER